MKVRVVITVDVDDEEFRDRYPLAIRREGGVREAVRAYVRESVRASDASRNASFRSTSLGR